LPDSLRAARLAGRDCRFDPAPLSLRKKRESRLAAGISRKLRIADERQNENGGVLRRIAALLK